MCRIAAKPARRLNSGAGRFAVAGLPAERPNVAGQLAKSGLGLGLAEVAHCLAEVPAPHCEAEWSAR